MGLISRLLLQGPLACKIFRDLCAIHESEGKSRKDLDRVQISSLTHCYLLFITLQSPVEDQAATAETRLFVLLQPNFCLLWPVSLQGSDFTLEEFPLWSPCGYLPTQNQTQANPSRNTIEKINKTGKAERGHRVTQDKSLAFPFQLQAWTMSRAFPVAHLTPEWNPSWVTVPGPRRWGSPLLTSQSHLNAITEKGPLDRRHKLQLCWSEKLFSRFYGDLATALAHISYFGFYFSSYLPWDINTDSRREMTLLSSYFNCPKLLLFWHPPSKTPFQNTDLATFLCHFFQ